MVLRRIQDETGMHKLNSRWEGPFLMHKVTGPGSYRLQYPNGEKVPNSWNIATYGVITLSQLVSIVVSCGIAWSTRVASLSHF
jgi:hypothetical protein